MAGIRAEEVNRSRAATGIVFPSKSDVLAIKCQQPVIGGGDPMCIRPR